MESKNEFVIGTLSREDISMQGYNPDELSDDQMKEIASQILQRSLDSEDYWDVIRKHCEKNKVGKYDSEIKNNSFSVNMSFCVCPYSENKDIDDIRKRFKAGIISYIEEFIRDNDLKESIMFNM